ncbi:pentapeptide repeat-containing protein [Saccharopolyspora taberi]|uniref:Pentapeptide repeat-containing protein n=1 Tax=Saccharopolyspora taberi TaxID=60895 RepID=A0ABN3VI72_9PSEU
MQGREAAGEPDLPAEEAAPRPKEVAKPRSFEWLGQLGNLITGLATAAALIFTAISVAATRDQITITREQAATAQEGQLTDRFTKAVEQLGAEKLEVRVGGVYALERIARDSPRDHPAVMDVLTAFIREHPPASPFVTNEYGSYPLIAADLRAASVVIGRREATHDSESGLLLLGAPLAGTDFNSAQLAYVSLIDADLTSATIVGTDLTNADLTGADLTNADLSNTDLSNANLTSADLTGANLTDAKLNLASLAGANLEGARLERADLTSADMTNANLTNADFWSAYLRGADFTGTNRTGTNLDGANITGAIGLPR